MFICSASRLPALSTRTRPISLIFFNLSGTRSIQQKGLEMARCERYTERGRWYRKVHRELSRRCSVTKDETCNNRGICSFSSSCSFIQRLPTVGSQVRVPSENSPPVYPSQLVKPRRHQHHHPLQPSSLLPPRRRRRWCRCRLFLNFAVAAAGFLLGRTWTNARLLCHGVELHGHSNHRWRLPSLKRVGATSWQIPFWDFTENVGPSLTPAVSSLKTHPNPNWTKCVLDIKYIKLKNMWKCNINYWIL